MGLFGMPLTVWLCLPAKFIAGLIAENLPPDNTRSLSSGNIPKSNQTSLLRAFDL
jgi:hypothetical protein